MDLQIRSAGLPAPVLEHRFAPPRKWRFDKCWPDRRIALELEGGTWHQGRHQRPVGFENDCVKYTEAAIRGWTVIRATKQMVEDGRALDLLRRAFAATDSPKESA